MLRGFKLRHKTHLLDVNFFIGFLQGTGINEVRECRTDSKKAASFRSQDITKNSFICKNL